MIFKMAMRIQFKSSVFCPILIFLIFLFCALPVQAGNPIKDMYEKATAAFERGDFAEAIDAYEKTIAMYPNLAQAHNALGLAKKEAGRSPEEVIACFKRAVEIDPTFAESYDHLGKIYYAMAEFDLAIESCETALKINPQMVTSRLSLGWITLLGKSDPASAIDHFSQVTDNYNIAMAHFGLGLSYFMDDQKFRVLEMITSLRQMGEDDFAGQLETMISQGRFVAPTINGTPLIAPRKTAGVSEGRTLVDEPLFDEEQKSFDRKSVAGRMKVRLRNPTLNAGPSATGDRGFDADQTNSGTLRLQELKERGRGLSF